MQIIDAHHHLWQFGRFDYRWIERGVGPLGRDHLPEDLRAAVAPLGVTGTVLVQTIATVDESMWFCDLAEKHDLIRGVVGWADVTCEQFESQLDRLQQRSPKFVGIRRAFPNDAQTVAPELLRGLGMLQDRGLAFDLLLRPAGLKLVPQIAGELPDLPMVIDHLAKPPIAEGLLDPWADDLAAAAAYPNVTCKLSGMITEADRTRWTADHLRPYIDHALQCFGCDRLMFGSDWPVCLLAGSYRQAFDALNTRLADRSDEERQAIYHDTATRCYRLSPRPPRSNDAPVAGGD